MYALVFWTRTKTTSIVSENCLCPVKDEGETTNVRYEPNQKLYKAKIVRKSDDSDYLGYLKVTKEGEILRKGINTASKLALSQVVAASKELKNKDKQSAKKRALNSSDEDDLLNSRSILEDEDGDGPESLEDNISKDSGDEAAAKEGGSSADSNASKKNAENLPPKKRPSSAVDPSSSEEESLSPQSRRKNIVHRFFGTKDLSKNNSSNSDDSNSEEEPVSSASPPEKSVAGVTKRRSLRPGAERNSRKEPSPGPLDHAENEVIGLDANADPLKICRLAGQGRVQLCDSFNVWIDKAELVFIQRWNQNPREMTRRLLGILIGKDNLKKMCARGRSKTRPGVPKDILIVIEYYVNRKCSTPLKPSEFTDVVNYMCGTIRVAKK